ncbi:MAG: type IV pilus twitching motility protein PilT [Pyrinomonadaceae bacterium]|nr:type IV pilus twitching motility protein PilT [Pyrinomonadaceae bacterium]
MEKLNEYLKTLISTSSYELRLEPEKQPYLVSAAGNAELPDAPLPGTYISTLVFPLIPPDVKQQLPNQPEIQFVHPHSLGKFSFTIKKSPAGFIVSVRPLLGEPLKADVEPPRPAAPNQPVAPKDEFVFESSSLDIQQTNAFDTENAAITEIEIERPQDPPRVEITPGGPTIEVISANDPAFTTVFSDTSTYEPPGRRDDYVPQPVNAAPPAPRQETAPQAATEVVIEATPLADRRSYDKGSDRRKVNTIMQDRMDALFRRMAEVGSSDLHLSVSMPPMIRKDGRMQVLECGEQTLTPEIMAELLTAIMPEKNREEFARRNDTDFAYEIIGLARFRCNVFMDRKGMGAVFRIIPSKILTAEDLGLSKAIMDLCSLSKGLVVVTGPTGSGKSTTLCAMVDHINKSREDHIITIEDPIEFVHENHQCLVNQREVHNHTDSFKDALRAALREDPDILLVGEMRDLETISIAIETAETGHLVFGTLHTTTAASTVDRIIDQFPADRQQQIRVMLSESLKGVIAQTLLPKKGGGRVAALEILIVTPAISNLIREGKTFQIPSAMQTGKNNGMVMLNDALFAHVQKGLVEPRDAYIKAVDKVGFETMLTRGGFKL